MSFHPSFTLPFWASAIMHQEPLFFVEREDGESATGLIFPPLEVLSLTSASGEVPFEEGRDYILPQISGSGSGAPGTVLRPPGSRIPLTRREDVRKLWNTSNEAFPDRTAVITYRHAGSWLGFIPPFAGDQLPRTIDKLARLQPLRMSLAGDSIAEGHNASGFMKLPPHQPAFGSLVASGLEHAQGASVSLHNVGTEGWTTDHGLYVDDVIASRPDLVLISYGMNDLGYADAQTFGGNMRRIIENLRRPLPDVELILISPMLANPAWDYPVHSRSFEYRDALAQLCGAGIALADMTSLWRDLLRHKNYYELSGNGLNHPNDFGHRLYAQVILGLLNGSGCNSRLPQTEALSLE